MKYFLPFFLCLLPFLSHSQTQIGNDIDGESSGDRSGIVALSADGSIVAIGAPSNDDSANNAGHVRVFENNGGSWIQLGSDIDGEAAEDFSGRVDISADGSILAIGASNNDGNGNNSGHVRVYEYIAGNWIQTGADIDGESSGDKSGFKVRLSDNGSILAVSAIDNDDGGNDSGHVRVFENNSGNWIQLGTDIDGESSGDESGYGLSISSDGTIVAVGARLSDSNGTQSGKVKVYQYNMNNWTQVGQDIDGELFDQSGNSVSLSSDGSVVAIGAFASDDNENAAGQVKVYQNNADTWTQIGQDINGLDELDTSGSSVSLSSDGSVLAIGAPAVNSVNNEGYVRVYQNITGSWTQIGVVIYGDASLDYSGGSVSLSSDGSILAIGATGNDGNGSNSGHVRVFDLSAVLSSNQFIQINFDVFPNPTANIIKIRLGEGLQLEKVNVYSSSGQLLKTANETLVSVEEMATGNYFLEVITNKGKATKMMIVE